MVEVERESADLSRTACARRAERERAWLDLGSRIALKVAVSPHPCSLWLLSARLARPVRSFNDLLRLTPSRPRRLPPTSPRPTPPLSARPRAARPPPSSTAAVLQGASSTPCRSTRPSELDLCVPLTCFRHLPRLLADLLLLAQVAVTPASGCAPSALSTPLLASAATPAKEAVPSFSLRFDLARAPSRLRRASSTAGLRCSTYDTALLLTMRTTERNSAA